MNKEAIQLNEEGVRFSEAKQKLIEMFLTQQSTEKLNARPTIPHRSAGEPIPLSFPQQQVWVHSQMVGDVPIYNEAITIFRKGPLDIAVLERCMLEILRRHEIWRTTFDTVGGDPVQIVQPIPDRFPLRRADLRHICREEREAEALHIATEDARKPFDLRAGPPLRAILVRMDEEEHRLYMTFHQIVFDAISAYRVLVPELSAMYAAFSAGQASPLQEPILQYGDFASWQRNGQRDSNWTEQLSFWRDTLSGELPVLPWPNDYACNARGTHRGTIQRFDFASGLIQPLRAFCRDEGVSSYAALVASYAALLSRYTGQEDIVIGGLSADRGQPELESLAGYFVNPFALRIDLSGSPSFRELTKRVMGVVLDALANVGVPFQRVIEDLHLRPALGRNPIFQIVLSQQPRLPAIAPGWDLTTEEVSSGASKMDMVVVLDERSDSISGPITYDPDLFDASTVSRMVEHWQAFLAGALANPESRISDLPLLTASERTQLIVEWNGTVADYPRDSCLHQLIEAQTGRTPNAVALIFEAQQILYRDLNARANQLAHYLRRLGVGPDVLVGVCLERSAGMPVALLGVLKAGGAYVPLDPSYPKDRLAFMVEDSGLRVLVTDQELAGRWSDLPVELVCMDRDREAISREKDGNPKAVGNPENLAYVIYTSGSTGRPKGVQIPHRALVNLVNSVRAVPGVAEHDVMLGLTTISFDIAAVEMYVPLTVGARIVLISRQMATDPDELARRVDHHRVTVMQATPATWRMLIESGWRGKSDLKILCTGEALSRDLADQLLARGASVWNLYGPTETTIWSTLDRIRPDGKPILIGRPLANTQTYILDQELHPLPVGAIGELYIGGDGLARGYLNRAELTTDRFVHSPFRTDSRIYKTGDLARFHADGRIECLGRIDHQVKIRGHRIELGEIEASLRQHESVREAAVVVREDAGDRKLVAYVALSQRQVSLRPIRDFLKQKLPLYMIPELVRLDRLPLTPNGKLDRKSLPLTSTTGAEIEETNFGEPRDEIERLLAQLWREALHIERLSVYDNFFDLGGHSLSAIQVLARLQNHLGVCIKPVEMAFQSLGQLAAVCKDRMERQ
ncbi:MAG TPA: amino acid adenylation domain-containing protein [Candidatus Acidoferrales bacterium]|nr:amino acid adenylation domain-containing protein [Candidatus Acidoferrales bacterium]